MEERKYGQGLCPCSAIQEVYTIDQESNHQDDYTRKDANPPGSSHQRSQSDRSRLGGIFLFPQLQQEIASGADAPGRTDADSSAKATQDQGSEVWVYEVPV